MNSSIIYSRSYPLLSLTFEYTRIDSMVSEIMMLRNQKIKTNTTTQLDTENNLSPLRIVAIGKPVRVTFPIF